MQTSETFGHVAAALAAAQGQFGHIARDKVVKVATRTGSSYTFAYAPLETIMAAIRPALAANQLAIVQGPVAADSGIEYLRTMIIHSSGEWLANDTAVMVDRAEGGKSAQAYGSGLTYARRYGITNLLCLVADDDDDGNAAEGNHVEPVKREARKPAAKAAPKPELIGDAERAEMERRLAALGKEPAAFAQYLGVASLSELPVAKLAAATAALSAAERKVRGSEEAAA